jgi:hypothetical protein
MSRYFYYRRNDEWVRVLADSYTQGSPPPSPGECPTTYRWSFDCLCKVYPSSGSPPYTYLGSYYQLVYGPISQYQLVLPGTLVGGMQDFQAAPLEYSLNGVVTGGFQTSDPNYTYKNRSNNIVIGPVSNLVITRLDGQADNCSSGGGGGGGGACQTRFFLSGVQVLGLDSCPEVLDSADDCSDCCRLLLPIARAISI